MIYDTLSNLSRYRGISDPLDKAIGFLTSADLSALSGRTVIDGDRVYLNVQDAQLRPFSEGRWEAHRAYIDIQIALTQGETIHYAPLNSIADWEPYQWDVHFSLDANRGIALPMTPGTFGLFMPQDAHRPGIGEGTVHKLVVKVAAE